MTFRRTIDASSEASVDALSGRVDHGALDVVPDVPSRSCRSPHGRRTGQPLSHPSRPEALLDAHGGRGLSPAARRASMAMYSHRRATSEVIAVGANEPTARNIPPITPKRPITRTPRPVIT